MEDAEMAQLPVLSDAQASKSRWRLSRRRVLMLMGALFAVALVVAWDLAEDAGVDPLGYAARGAAFLVLGVVLGRFVSRRNALERKIRRYFDSSLDLLATADFNGYFKELNPAWEKTLGYKRGELMARPFVDFVHPEDRARTLAESEKLTRPGAE